MSQSDESCYYYRHNDLDLTRMGTYHGMMSHVIIIDTMTLILHVSVPIRE